MSIFDEMIDSLFWVADQRGCGEEVRKEYQRLCKEESDKKLNAKKESKCIDRTKAKKLKESRSLKDLDTKALELYDAEYPRHVLGEDDPRVLAFVEAFTPKELAELWASCMYSKENPFGQPYDDEVYDAIMYLGIKSKSLSNSIFTTANNIYDKKYHSINSDGEDTDFT